MGGIVLDPYIGSGTTAVACINTGRRFIGIENTEEYYKIAVKRAKHARAKRRGNPDGGTVEAAEVGVCD
jgi:site-specific DNA-methyltransferase (adenine-specific)